MLRVQILALGLVLALFSAAGAQETRAGLGPAIPKASGDPHPEGNDYMRRWHMTMMKHDRDETMYEGDREVGASLGECFECHTVKDANGTPVTYADETHFCRTCHDFAAVKVDCFDCHRSTPADFEEPAAHATFRRAIEWPKPGDAPIIDLQTYLDARTLTTAEALK